MPITAILLPFVTYLLTLPHITDSSGLRKQLHYEEFHFNLSVSISMSLKY
jgi:hypothetical protein